MFHFFSLHLYNRLSAVGVTQQLPVWGPSLGTRGPPRGMVLNPGMPMDGWPWKDPPIFKFGKPAGKPSISIRAVASWRSVSHNQRVNDINVLICTDAYSDTHTHTFSMRSMGPTLVLKNRMVLVIFSGSTYTIYCRKVADIRNPKWRPCLATNLSCNFIYSWRHGAMAWRKRQGEDVQGAMASLLLWKDYS